MSEFGSTTKASAPKPRVMLMADVPNWIFARHCQVLMRLLSEEFEFDFKLRGDLYSEDDYDLIYPLEWNLIPASQILIPAKYVTGIRSHILWRGRDFAEVVDLLNFNYQSVHAVSHRLTEVFRPYLQDVRCLTHGVDTEFFTATTTSDLSGPGRIRIGWAGNRINKSKWFDDFIQPLAAVPGVELVFCGFHDRNLDLAQMKEFYDSIDCYVCASSVHHEGNNNPLMEASSMERAIITTDNGAVSEYLRDGINALIVEPELPNFIQAVCELRDDPARRVRLGRAARTAVTATFDWRDMAAGYAQFFSDALARRDSWTRPTESMTDRILPGGTVSAACIPAYAGIVPPFVPADSGVSSEQALAKILLAREAAINHRIRQVDELRGELRVVVAERDDARRGLSDQAGQFVSLQSRVDFLEKDCREKEAVICNYHRMSKDPVITLYRKVLRTLNLWKH